MASEPSKITIYWLEALAVGGLLLWANAAALTVSLAGAVTLMHAAALTLGFLMVRHLLARAAEPLAHLLFALVVTLLSAEVILATFSGLHLSRFVLSLALQPQAASQIGLSGGWALMPALLAVAAYMGSRLIRQGVRTAARPLLAIVAILVLSSQGIYAFLLYQRDPALLTQQRDMVFFEGLHHYYAEQLFTPLVGPRPANPMARSFALPGSPTTDSPDWVVTRPKDVLIVVIDSLRAQDMAADPDVAPNLLAWGQDGFLSLTHRSVSNCTHFSMHTLFTGQLATDFGQRRKRGYSPSLFHSLQKAGYAASTEESSSLDWYDLATTYMQGVERTVASQPTFKEADQAVIERTLTRLLAPAKMPRLHLAYLNGPHFSAEELLDKGTIRQAYFSRVKETDALLGSMLDRLNGAGKLDDMLVIITSDHGEQLLEDGIVGHASILNREQTVVPFLVLGADGPTDWIRSHRDLVPLIRNELSATAAEPPARAAEILVGCDYAFPRSFAVLEGVGQTDFDFQDGLLRPAGAPGSKKAAQEAALLLISEIQR